jgi:hypothetical protein
MDLYTPLRKSASSLMVRSTPSSDHDVASVDAHPTAGGQGMQCGGMKRQASANLCEYFRSRRSLLISPAHFRQSRRVLTRPDPPLQLIRNQQVSGSSPLAGSNLALIKRAASDPVLMGALSDPTVCANYVQIFPA